MKAILVDANSKKLFVGTSSKANYFRWRTACQSESDALNRADLLQMRGLYPPPKGESTILGLEMSGTIEEVGGNVEGCP